MTLRPARHQSPKRKPGPRPNLSRRPSHRPSLHRRWIRRAGKTLMGVLAIGFIAWVCVAGYRSGAPMVATWLTVKDVTVAGNSQIPRSEVLDYLKLEAHATLLSITPERLARRLEAHPWIKRADVNRVPPNGLAIHIVERHGAAVLRSPSTTLLLDEDGHVLSVLSEATEPGLPVLVGLNPKRLMSGEREPIQTAQRGIELAGILARSFDGRPEVDVANGDNVVAYVQGLRLQFGTSAFEEKWELYRKLEPHVLSSLNSGNHDRTDGRSDIDLRYPGKVIVRERG